MPANWNEDVSAAIEAAALCIERADALVITAGAGMGVDSGLPDYRGVEGLWRAYPRLRHLGLAFEEMANPQWFDTDPKLAWAFYGHRQQLYRDAKPHAGHALLKAWGDAMPQGHFVYTSNVDGHFHFAGFDSQRLVECHGNIHRLQCSAPCSNRIWQDGSRDLDIELENLQARGELPRCPECHRIARPNVLMFYDWSWVRDIAMEQLNRYNEWIHQLKTHNARIAVIEIGAGTSLPAIRYESETLLSQTNAQLIRINPREADGPEGTVSIPMPALEPSQRMDSTLRDRGRSGNQ